MRPADLLLTLLALSLLPLHAAEAAEPAPLFQDDSVLAITLKGPITTLMRERPDDEELPVSLTFPGADGSPLTVDVKLRTRGNYRRERRTCPFAPVRLNFKKGQVKKTVFHKQDKLKLVTHCRDNAAANHTAVHREYLAYRILNALTDASLRVRLLEITWIDTDKKDRSITRYGFLIEEIGDLAKRIGRKELRIPRTTVAELDPAYTNLTSVYQFLIANTDFSPIAAAPGENCCHNGKLLGKTGEPTFAIPYDFDMAGFVDAPYATPNPKFKLRNVKERLYRGRCVNNEQLPTSLAHFRDNREAIEALVREYPYLDDRDRRESLRFIASFFELIDDPKYVDRQLLGRCLG